MTQTTVIDKPVEDIESKKSKAGKENLKQRAYLNTVSSLMDYIANRLTGLFVNPFIVGGLGTSLFGTWQMLGQLTGYINIADTRSSQVLKWTVAQKKDIATTEELRSDMSAAFVVLLFVVPIILIVGSVIAWHAPYITHAEKSHYTAIRITCSLLIFSVLVFKFFELFEAVLRGMNLSFKRMGLRAGIVIVGGGLKILAITLGYGLAGLAAVQLIVSLLIGLSFYWVVKRNIEWFGFAKPSRSNILRFGKLSAWYLADAGANVVNSHSDKLLLGIIAGPVAVAYYTLTLFIPVALQGLINKLILGIMPGIGKLLGLKEYDRINNVRKNIYNVTLLLTTAFGATTIIFNHSFLSAWVGTKYFAGNTANVLIIAITMQDTFVKNDSYLISATLDIRRKVWLTVISGLLFAGFGLLLVGTMGIAGLCVSLMISRVFLFAGQRKIIAGIMKTRPGSAFIFNYRPLVTSLLMLGMAIWLATQTGLFGIVQLMIYAPAALLISSLIFYFFGLSLADRLALQQIISSIKFFKSDRAFSKN